MNSTAEKRPVLYGESSIDFESLLARMVGEGVDDGEGDKAQR